MRIFKGKKDKPKEKNLSENVVRIEVYRLLGDSVPYSIATFEAIQDRDADNNLVLVNVANSYKDDVEIIKNKLISDLHFTLDLHQVGDEKKVEIITKKIQEQETFIKSIKDGYGYKVITGSDKKEKVKVNVLDEECNLTKYKVFLDSIKNNGEGSYETIDSEGKKRILYLYKEGILYPYKFIKTKNTMYPDVSSKRKIYKQEQDLIDQEYLNDNKGFLSGFKQYLFLGLIVIMILGNIYWSVQLYKAYANFDESTIAELMDKAEGSAIRCAYWYATIGEETSQFVENYEKLINERDIRNEDKTINVG